MSNHPIQHFISKHKTELILFTAGVCLILAGILYNRETAPYSPGKDEIALRIRLDTKEDIGLLVYDYDVNGHTQGGGISNANRTPLKHNDVLILSFLKEELPTDADFLSIPLRFRVITEYTDPNFENIYPEEWTRYLDPFLWEARFGDITDITITGSKDTGYTVLLP